MNEAQGIVDGIVQFGRSIGAEFASIWFYLQIVLILAALATGQFLAAIARKRIDLVSLTMGWPTVLRLVVRESVEQLGIIIFILLITVIQAVISEATWPSRVNLLGVAAKLATAWVIIYLIASIIRNKFVYRAVAITAWTIAALSILGLLDRAAATLDSVGIVIGGLRISPLLVLKTTGLLLVTLWVSSVIAHFLENRIRSVTDLTPSLQVLIGKLVWLFLVTIAIVVVLSSVGIDLSALALFSGAVGVGVGFGLQKIVSNLFSGIILLADKSIKPGDVITVGDNYGWVDSMKARYTSVVTRDGREFLIPNEDLVTQQVINWSHSSNQVRLEVKFGVSYGSDPHKVIALAVQTAVSNPRVLKQPEPVCYLADFGASSLDFALRFWITDPALGVTNVRGIVLLALWDVFRREGIEIPYAVRDLRVSTPVHVVMGDTADTAKTAKKD